MASNAYGRLQPGVAMTNTGATTSYGGGYGHGSHGHGSSHVNNQNDSNYVNNIQPEDYLGKFNKPPNFGASFIWYLSVVINHNFIILNRKVKC